MSEGYTHDAIDDTVEESDGHDPDGTATPTVAHPEEHDREFDYRGWALVAAIFVAFLVVPGILVAYPHVGPMFGLGFWDAYLVLPLVPALVLGVLAVWATTRP